MANDFDFITTRFGVAKLEKGQVIEAGTMIVIPDFNAEGERMDDDVTHPFLPAHAIIMGGQRLSREMYPELSSIFTSAGGFYEFILPDLERKFLLDFNDEGKPITGSGAIFYQTVPVVEEPYAELRDAITRR